MGSLGAGAITPDPATQPTLPEPPAPVASYAPAEPAPALPEADTRPTPPTAEGEAPRLAPPLPPGHRCARLPPHETETCITRSAAPAPGDPPG